MPTPKQFKTHEEYLQWYRDYREKNRKKFRAYNYKYNKLWRKKNGFEQNCGTWQDRHPKAKKASYILNYAVKTGKIKRLPCEVEACKNKKTQGHHNNYDEPLKVIWLCHKHHKWVHANFTLEELKTIIEPELLLNFLRELDKVKN